MADDGAMSSRGGYGDGEAQTRPLPFIDVHAIEVNAKPERAWRGVVSLVHNLGTGAPQWALAAVLGATDRLTSGLRGMPGSTVPGFQVAVSDPPSVLILAGSHRFSTYELAFRVEPVGPSKSRVLAESRALFPGHLGTAYRALVIGSGGHSIAVKAMLRRIKRISEGSTPDPDYE